MFHMSAFVLRKKKIVTKLKECGAVSQENAKTLEEANVPYPHAFPNVTKDLERQQILVKTKDHRYYLNTMTVGYRKG